MLEMLGILETTGMRMQRRPSVRCAVRAEPERARRMASDIGFRHANVEQAAQIGRAVPGIR